MEVKEIRRQTSQVKNLLKVKNAKRLANSLSRKIIELELQDSKEGENSRADIVVLDRSYGWDNWGRIILKVIYSSDASPTDAYALMKRYVKASTAIEGFPKFIGNPYIKTVKVDGLPDIFELELDYFPDKSSLVPQGKTRVDVTVTGYIDDKVGFNKKTQDWTDDCSESDSNSKYLITSNKLRIFEEEPKITLDKTFDSLDSKKVNEFLENAKKCQMPFYLFWTKSFNSRDRHTEPKDDFKFRNYKWPVRLVHPLENPKLTLHVSVGEIAQKTLTAYYNSYSNPFIFSGKLANLL